MSQRINITLSEETLHLLDRLTSDNNRSRFIDRAIKHYAEAVKRASLKKQLKEGALNRAERDLGLAEEWFPLEEELWPEPTR